MGHHRRQIGDRRGSFGAGAKTGANEVYGKIDFNEKTGRAGVTLSNEHTLNDHLAVRGEGSVDNRGKLAGGLGARLENDLGYLDAEIKANAKSGSKGATVKGRYDLTEATNFRFRYSDTNRRKPPATWAFPISSATPVVAIWKWAATPPEANT